MTVVIDPRLSFGRPVLSKVAVPTEVIMDRFRAGDSVAEMAGDYGVGEDEIEEALRFEPIGHIFPFLSGAERVAHSPYVIRPVPVNAPIVGSRYQFVLQLTPVVALCFMMYSAAFPNA